MFLDMSVIYVDYISHFEFSVCFWQIKRLVVFKLNCGFLKAENIWMTMLVLDAEAVKKMILGNRRITIRKAADTKQFLQMF